MSTDIRVRLAANAKRRQQAETKLGAARDELAQLLAAGRQAGLSVSEMALLAKCSRETAHKLLREAKP
jgi:hypothetical protein